MDNEYLSPDIAGNPEFINRIVARCGCCYYDYTSMIRVAVRQRYSIEDELAIQRQRDSKPDEFAEYDAFVESCKADAKARWQAQEEAITQIRAELDAG